MAHHHHAHGSQCSHHTLEDKNQKAFIVGIALNTVFIFAEIAFGFWSNSMALLADAGHNAGDVIGLLLSWGAFHLQKAKPTSRLTYGLQSTTIMAALLNAIILLLATGSICLEAIQRINQPEEVSSITIIIVASIGILINGFSAYLFYQGSKEDLNIRGAFLHMAADAAISLGVVFSGFAIWYGNWIWLDPVISLVISLIIIMGTFGLFKESILLSFQAVPRHINITKVMEFLKSQENVKEVHDLHIWAMSTRDVALSVHLLMPSGHPGDKFIYHLNRQLKQLFNISHTTLQIEVSENSTGCLQSLEHQFER